AAIAARKGVIPFMKMVFATVTRPLSFGRPRASLTTRDRQRPDGRDEPEAPPQPGGPMRLDSFARYPLLFGPSPLTPLERLSAHLGGARIWAKREDCNSGLAFGGNKVRKLEYLV